ncbi:MAG: hypothetical protein CMP23_16450 [Rickettsiales bacterium]|nr:hypothetical protein [Rickettsiales bacterium]
MQSIQASDLESASSADVAALLRQLRVVQSNVRIYEPGHGQRLIAHRGLWELLLELHEELGQLLIEVVPWGLLINGKGLENESQGGRLVTAWFQERGISNLFFDGRGRLEELAEQLDALEALEPDEALALRGGWLPTGMERLPLRINVSVHNSTQGEGSAAPAAAQPDAEEWPVAPEPASELATEAVELVPERVADEQAPAAGWSGRLEHLEPGESVAGVQLGPAAESEALGQEPVAEEAAAEHDQLALDQLQAIVDGGVDLVFAALAAPLSEEVAESFRRRSLLEALQASERAGLRAAVLARISVELGESVAVGSGIALLQAGEELVSSCIAAGQLRSVSSFCNRLVELVGGAGEVAGRATAARVFISSEELIRLMIEKMEVLPTEQCSLIRDILRGFSAQTLPCLLDLMVLQERKSVRLSICDVIKHHLDNASEPAELEQLCDPLIRGLGRADSPWYVKRNLVYILSSVELPSTQRALMRLTEQDQDPRVLTEVVRALLESGGPGASALLGRMIVDPRFSDAAGVFELVRALYPCHAQQVQDGLEQRLTGKDVKVAVAEGGLLGLALAAGEDCLPFLIRLLSEKNTGLLKRPAWSEPVRAAALEAIATLRGQPAREALSLGREDRISEIRRMAVELSHMEPSRAAVAAYRRIGVDPNQRD